MDLNLNLQLRFIWSTATDQKCDLLMDSFISFGFVVAVGKGGVECASVWCPSGRTTSPAALLISCLLFELRHPALCIRLLCVCVCARLCVRCSSAVLFTGGVYIHAVSCPLKGMGCLVWAVTTPGRPTSCFAFTLCVCVCLKGSSTHDPTTQS